jgi:hypothetical protein
MPTTIRNLLLAAAIAVGTVPVVGQAAQAGSFEIGGAGFSVGFGDDDVEFGTDLYSDDWDDDEVGIELEFGVDEDDEDDEDGDED